MFEGLPLWAIFIVAVVFICIAGAMAVAICAVNKDEES